MIAVIDKASPLKLKADLVRVIESQGLRVQVTEVGDECWIGVVGSAQPGLSETLAAMKGVREVRPVAPAYPMVSRAHQPRATRVRAGNVTIGGDEVIVMAGPCSVESREQLMTTARSIRESGAHILRGGAFKPRSSPYSFQGLGREGLELLAEARAATGMPIITEVLAPEEVEMVGEFADVLQIGARNMQNFRLLSAVGQQSKPVFLKRGLMSTIEEFLLAAEYIVAEGNPRVILCERGIRTFETSMRNTLDLAAVPLLKERTHLPIIVDPSHAVGLREFVPALARAAIAAGADGLMVETHPDPEKALTDGRQSLTLEAFAEMMRDVSAIAAAIQRVLAPTPTPA